MAPLFKQITVCGVGLIGGSLALIAQARGAGRADRRVGPHADQPRRGAGARHDRRRDARPRRGGARRRPGDARDAGLTLPDDARRDDSVSCRPTAVITDVGSVKGWVVRELEPLLGPQMALVGVHPVAGKETTGAGRRGRELVRRTARDRDAVGAQHARCGRSESSACGGRPARSVERMDARCA